MKVIARSSPLTSVATWYAPMCCVIPLGLARDDVRLADGVQQSGLTVVDVTHDGHDRRTGDEHLLATLVLTELDGERLEQLAVLLLGADDLNGVVHLVAEERQRLVGDRLGGRDHLAEVHHHGDERRRVGADLLREVGEGGTAGQANGLAATARQHHAADGRGLHGLVLLAPLTLGLATATGRTAGTAEGTLRATTGTGAAGTPAEARTTAAEAAATATGATATGTTGEAAAATGTTAAAGTGRTACEATAAGTTGTARTACAAGTTAAATGTRTRARGGTLRHHARVRAVTGGSAGTRGATGGTLRTRHAARGRTGTALALRARGTAGTALRTGTAGAGTLAAGTRGATGTGGPAGGPCRWSHRR
ncbi:hypothetical protein GCM10020000_21860 [Streptomyces olivoverticillatus]